MQSNEIQWNNQTFLLAVAWKLRANEWIDDSRVLLNGRGRPASSKRWQPAAIQSFLSPSAKKVFISPAGNSILVQFSATHSTLNAWAKQAKRNGYHTEPCAVSYPILILSSTRFHRVTSRTGGSWVSLLIVPASGLGTDPLMPSRCPPHKGEHTSWWIAHVGTVFESRVFTFHMIQHVPVVLFHICCS